MSNDCEWRRTNADNQSTNIDRFILANPKRLWFFICDINNDSCFVALRLSDLLHVEFVLICFFILQLWSLRKKKKRRDQVLGTGKS